MPESRDSSVQVAIIVAGLLAVVGGAWVFLNSGNEAALENTQIATTVPVAPSPLDTVVSNTELLPVDTALQMAEMAFQSGQLTGNEEGSAVGFYRQVLEQEPDNRRAKTGLQLISTQLVDEAEEMISKGNYREVVQRIGSLNSIEPGSDAVLLLQQRLNEEAAGMFSALDLDIAGGDLDRAERLARSLRQIPSADPERINTALEAIAAARLEAQNAAAAETARQEAELAATQAAAADAQQALDAVTDGSTEDVMAEVIDPAEQLREQIAALLVEANANANADRLVEPDGNNALELYNQVLALDSANAEAKRGLRGLVQKLTSSAYDLAEAGSIEQARAVLDSAESVGIAKPLVTQAREDVRQTWIEAESQKVFALSGFKVQKSVPPKYPKRAETRSVEGWVKVAFTVAEDGNTRDLEVIDSSTRLTKQFTNAAINAVEQWQFEPRVLDGEVIAQRSETTVQFKLTE